MTVERLKIRCYQCNQLLAVTPNKAGTVVACPKCKADLLIPRPESPGRAGGAEEGGSGANSPVLNLTESTSGTTRMSAESPAFLQELAAIIPPELAALRPEDLRVEAEFFDQLSHEPTTPVRSTPEPALTARSDPFQFPDTFDPSSLPPPPEKPFAFSSEVGFAVAADAVSAPAASDRLPPPLPIPPADVVVPPIQIEPPSVTLLPPRRRPAASAR